MAKRYRCKDTACLCNTHANEIYHCGECGTPFLPVRRVRDRNFHRCRTCTGIEDLPPEKQRECREILEGCRPSGTFKEDDEADDDFAMDQPCEVEILTSGRPRGARG